MKEAQAVTVVVVLVLHERVTETVVVKSSECQLVMMVLAVHDGGWQCLVLSSSSVPGLQPARLHQQCCFLRHLQYCSMLGVRGRFSAM